MWTVQSWYDEGRAKAAAARHLYQNVADLLWCKANEKLPERERADRNAKLLAFHRQRIDSVPSLTKYPELRGMRELIDAELRGIRDGAGFDDVGLAAYYSARLYNSRVIYNSPKTIPGAKGTDNCTYIYFPTSERGPLLANNLDSSPAEKFDAPAWPAMNEHVLMGDVSSGIFLDEVSPELFPAPVFKLVSRYCRTSRETVELLERYNHFWGPCNRIVVDRNHDVAMIEKSACRMGVRWSADGFGFITAMCAEEPAMRSYLADRRATSLKERGLPAECNDTRYWGGAEKRRVLMHELLNEARAKPTLETMRAFIQFRDPKRGYVCYNGQVFYPGDFPVEFTLRTSLWLLREGKALWWAKEGDTASFDNPKPAVEYPDALRWD